MVPEWIAGVKKGEEKRMGLVGGRSVGLMLLLLFSLSVQWRIYGGSM